ncbi:DUF6600 domain-containing protein [Chitinimonas sp.]|uniref:DUF6600 domain-containing protein n=1 Tax=Chitinimonas sp. TaxID=1934313 RepID=UPI002F93AD7C
MNPRTLSYRLAAMLLACLLPLAAHAEPDAPDRVARLNLIEGSVTFSPAGEDQWSYATLNRPLTSGDRLWTDQGGRAELHVGSHALRLNSRTGVDVQTLDDDNLQLRLNEGSLSFRVRQLWDDERIEIDTPNLAFEVRTPGEYRIDVDPDNDSTTVTLRQGEGMAYGDDGSRFRLRASAQVRFVGNRLDTTRAGDAPGRDSFDSWAQARDQREDKITSVRYVSRDTTGYEDLDQYGTWQQEADYGPVWVPRVTVVDWAPYRYGHWTWVAPWGWTWVDEAPWGFAPFHYGRWAHIRERWCWVPGPLAPRPVYAPALVAFAGGNGGWSVSIGVGRPGVAWFPLAPGEAYRPVYRASPRYVTRINQTVVINQTTVINQTVYRNQRIPHAVTAVPADAFVQGRAVQRSATRFDPRDFREARFSAAPAVAPTQQSLAGAARPWSGPAPDGRQRRPVVENHKPDTPPAWHDDLARRYLREGNVVDRAGPPPSHLGRTPPAIDPARSRQPEVSNANRRPPMPDAGHLTPMPETVAPNRDIRQNPPPTAGGPDRRPPVPDANAGQPVRSDNGIPRPPEREPRWRDSEQRSRTGSAVVPERGDAGQPGARDLPRRDQPQAEQAVRRNDMAEQQRAQQEQQQAWQRQRDQQERQARDQREQQQRDQQARQWQEQREQAQRQQEQRAAQEQAVQRQREQQEQQARQQQDMQRREQQQREQQQREQAQRQQEQRAAQEQAIQRQREQQERQGREQMQREQQQREQQVRQMQEQQREQAARQQQEQHQREKQERQQKEERERQQQDRRQAER